MESCIRHSDRSPPTNQPKVSLGSPGGCTPASKSFRRAPLSRGARRFDRADHRDPSHPRHGTDGRSAPNAIPFSAEHNTTNQKIKARVFFWRPDRMSLCMRGAAFSPALSHRQFRVKSLFLFHTSFDMAYMYSKARCSFPLKQTLPQKSRNWVRVCGRGSPAGSPPYRRGISRFFRPAAASPARHLSFSGTYVMHFEYMKMYVISHLDVKW